MSEPEGQGGQPPAAPPTLAKLVEAVEPQAAKYYGTMTNLGREGVIQSEGEIRRGVVAVNGAGLLAVISLLSQSFHIYTVRAAALLYLFGLLFGWIGWGQRARSSRMAYLAEIAFATAFVKLKSEPFAQKPLTTVEEIEEAGRTVNALVMALAERLKKPGNSVPLWTISALGCFFLATAALVADFELSPRLPPPGITHAAPVSAKVGPRS